MTKLVSAALGLAWSVEGEDALTFHAADRSAVASKVSLRKEVIQPQVPLRLPCYDLAPVTELTVGAPETVRLRVLPASMA